MVLVKDRIPFFQSFFQAIFSPVNASLSYLQGFFSQAEYVFKEETAIKMSHPSVFKKARPFLIGLALSIPVLFVLVSLFSSADPIYGSGVSQITRWFGQIFTGSFWKTFPERIIPSLVIGAALLPFIGFYSHKKNIVLPFKIRSLTISSEISVVLFAVIAVMTSFLFVQWRYIFLTVPFETNLSVYGVKTYSEYVTRGFFELILISLIVYFLTWAGLLVMRGVGEGKSKLLKILQIVLLSEFVILLFSMFRRIWLYQESHGWSLVRIYGGIFLIYLSILTLTLFLRHFKKYNYIRVEMFLLALGLIFTVFFNAEEFIIRTHPPTVNKNVDYVYLSRMSSDGIDGWIKAFSYADRSVSKFYKGNELFNPLPVNKNDRREVAYAGYILRRLIKHYDFLMTHYGTDADKRNYYKEIFNYLTYLPFGKFVYNNTNYSAGDKEYIKQQFLRDKVNQIDQNMPISDIEKVIRVDKTEWFFPYDNNNLNDIIPFSVATNNDTVMQFPPSRLDILYEWNYSDYQAFQKLKNELPISKWIAANEKYRFIFQDIVGQPENERDFDIDISVKSPLL